MASRGSSILDTWFFDGSIIQLKSKVTDKTLSLHHRGHVSGNGDIGVYAGCLGPRTRIWGRWTDGTFHRGTLSNVGTKVHIKFNDGDTISHDAKDLTAVVPDYDPWALTIGTRVIAQYRGSKRYYSGKVAGGGGYSYDIQFDDGDRGWARTYNIRTFSKEESSAGHHGPNDPIWARWTDGTYHPGKIANFATEVDIKFNDGDRISHDVHDRTAAVADVNPDPEDVTVGTRVIAQYRGKPRYYPGRVIDAKYQTYDIQFDDGDRGRADLSETRVLPPIATSVGTNVYGRWKNGLYYHGKVEKVDEKIHIKFDDGDRISHYPTDTKAVVLDIPPVTVEIGSSVIAPWPKRVQLYPGRVAYVDRQTCFVHYDDGDKGWVNVNKLRLMFITPDLFIVEEREDEMVALKSVAYPNLYLGIDRYGRMTGKKPDESCNFYIHKAPDYHVSLEPSTLLGQRILVDWGTVSARKDKGDDKALFQVTLLKESDSSSRRSRPITESKEEILEKAAENVGKTLKKTQLLDDRRRRMRGCEDKDQSPWHMLFFGNLGTGKTSFARCVADAEPHQATPQGNELNEEILEKMKNKMAQFVGLTDVKEQFIKFGKKQLLDERRRRMRGCEDKDQSPLHMLFLGNPGTGKTSFARCVAELLYSIGRIKENKVLEVQRSDLVGQYIGHTAQHTKAKIKEASGSVLFVDEAYRLVSPEICNDFGTEAIEELMSVMEKGDPVMIFAGYETPMAEFLKVNQGLQSRIHNKFVFSDYKNEELAQIFKQRVQEKGYHLATGVNVVSIIEHTTREQRASMNARLMRTLLEKSTEELSYRLPLNAPKKDLFEIKEEDMIAAAKRIEKA